MRAFYTTEFGVMSIWCHGTMKDSLLNFLGLLEFSRLPLSLLFVFVGVLYCMPKTRFLRVLRRLEVAALEENTCHIARHMYIPVGFKWDHSPFNGKALPPA